MKTKDPIRTAIKEHMKESGIEYFKDLAHQVGYTGAALSGIMSRKTKPTSAKAAKLCYELALKPQQLFEILKIEDASLLEKTIETYAQDIPITTADTFRLVYQLLSNEIERRYRQSDLVGKGKILGDLGEVVENFSGEGGSTHRLSILLQAITNTNLLYR